MDISAFFAAHGMDVEDPLLDRSDTISHLMNGYCANHVASGCVEISCSIRSPVEMAITITEMIVDEYTHKQILPEHLSIVCLAVGIKSGGRRPESLTSSRN